MPPTPQKGSQTLETPQYFSRQQRQRDIGSATTEYQLQLSNSIPQSNIEKKKYRFAKYRFNSLVMLYCFRIQLLPYVISVNQKHMSCIQKQPDLEQQSSSMRTMVPTGYYSAWYSWETEALLEVSWEDMLLLQFLERLNAIIRVNFRRHSILPHRQFRRRPAKNRLYQQLLIIILLTSFLNHLASKNQRYNFERNEKSIIKLVRLLTLIFNFVSCSRDQTEIKRSHRYIFASNKVHSLIQNIKIMLRANCVVRAFSDLTPHLKAINATGINSRNIIYNPSVPELYELAFKKQRPSDPHTRMSRVSSNGALCAFSGLKTGREPQNSRLVKDSQTEKTVNWGKINIPIDFHSASLCEQLAVDYINHHARTIVVDGYAGWDKKNRVKVRTFCTRTYHALFMRNMLIRPTEKQLEEDFSKGVDINIFNAGEMAVSRHLPGLTSNMVTVLNLTQRKMVILGSQFAGEMKKSVFKILQYYLPRKNILTLHASATLNQNGSSTIMCGLSATGKTALGLRSTKRKIIGDDETCWSDEGIFNIEGGCYAKTINLDKNIEPEIYDSIRYGSIVENCSFYPHSREINFNDVSLTPNSRTAFPLNFLKNVHLPSIGPHPSNIVFLTCDTKGVLPPVARLTDEQAYYQFLSGYTAKMGGTDLTASKTPESTFSACFGQIFLPLHPTVYAKMLYDKIKKHNVKVWLVNTGWTQGKYGDGHRISLQDSQKILDAINNNQLDNAPCYKFKHFNFQVPKSVQGVSEDLMYPEKGWRSKIEYDETLSSLAVEFIENFDKKFKGKLEKDHEEIVAKASPVIG